MLESDESVAELWFDVGIKRYTTMHDLHKMHRELWFDVGIKRYTTRAVVLQKGSTLWFDVGIKRYTTQQETETAH